MIRDTSEFREPDLNTLSSCQLVKLINDKKKELEASIERQNKEIVSIQRRVENKMVSEKSDMIADYKRYLEKTSWNLHSNGKETKKIIPFWDHVTDNRSALVCFCVITFNVNNESKHLGNIDIRYTVHDIVSLNSQSKENTKNRLFTADDTAFKSISTPPEMKANFKMIKSIIERNFSCGIEKVAPSSHEVKVLNNWITSYVQNYIDGIVKLKLANKKFGI